ncbi:MAG: hypothetical protein ACOYL6_13980 [Bacteriovoracaceae bacterium]
MIWLIPLFSYSLQSQALCLPDSALKIKTTLKNDSSVLAVEDIANKFVTKFTPKIKTDFRLDLNINLEVLNPKINAEIVKKDPILNISVWGGMVRHKKMNPVVMTLLLCHELGHLFGGTPYKSINGWSSTEGQADYYSTMVCVKEFDYSIEEISQAAYQLVSIYAEASNKAPPSIDQCDESSVVRINYGYPGIQCRYDTLMDGLNLKARPSCWYID